VVFADEPILEVHAPIIEAQLVETIVVNAIHFSTAVATKAARCVTAASGKQLIDFSLRRTPSFDAGLEVARVSYLAGFDATSNVLAGATYGIPIAGTVAHSFIEACSSEIEAFRAFGRTYPGAVTLLIDTYDSIHGAHNAVTVAHELAADGKRVAAVRLDSGDLAELSRAVRTILDDANLHDVRIVASGGLDEYALAELHRVDAPIDAYGVGTQLGTSADAPSLDMAYKLVEYGGTPCLKLSQGKQTLVGAKQVWRRYDSDGWMAEDLISSRDAPRPGDEWEPLLVPVVEHGQPVRATSLSASRDRHRDEMARLPERLRRLYEPADYTVSLSDELRRRQEAAIAAVRGREGL
jgi:nicotinate phosphoribosyltransferase